MSYEKVVQWAAGPYSAGVGWLSTQIVNHWHIFGKLGIGHSQVGAAIFNTGVFGVSAILTYAAHHKWLTNLTRWWATAEGKPVPAPINITDAPTEADKLRKQLQSAGMEPNA